MMLSKIKYFCLLLFFHQFDLFSNIFFFFFILKVIFNSMQYRHLKSVLSIYKYLSIDRPLNLQSYRGYNALTSL